MTAARGPAGVVLCAVLALAGCTGGGAEPAGPLPVEQVSYVTGFALQGQEAFMFVGKDRGIFAAHGLDVEVLPGKGTVANLQLLTAGRADYAILDLTGALIAYARDPAGTDVRIVAGVHQSTLSCLMALPDSGITTPRDLAGKTIGYQPGGVNHTMFPVYARLAGLDPAGVRWQQLAPPQFGAMLATGRVDAITQVVVSRPSIRAAAGGREPVVLAYSDVLADLYGNALAVSTARARDHPDQVARFRAALVESIAYTIAHPEEAAGIFVRHVPTYRAEVAAEEIRLLTPYVTGAHGGVGALDEQRVARNIAILRGAGALPRPVAPGAIVDFGPG